MTGLRYFALKQLNVYDVDDEPLTLDPGDLIPQELTDLWGDRGIFPAVSAGRIAPIPAAVAQLLEQAPSKAGRRAKPVAA